jgi:hypothetical protein
MATVSCPTPGSTRLLSARVLDTKVGAGKNDDAWGDGQGFESMLKSEGGRKNLIAMAKPEPAR